MNTQIKVIAHRGASGHFPENTIAAVREAARLGVDYIEIDVHQSKDGHVIVIHDATVDRTTNGTGNVEELTLEELKKLDAGSWKDVRFEGEQIPVLEEVLELISADVKLLLEVKKGNSYYQGIEKRILEILEASGKKDYVVIQSFHTPVLEIFRLLDSEIELHKLGVYQSTWLPVHIDHRFRFGRMQKSEMISQLNLYHKFCRKRTIQKIHSESLSIFVWTLNDKKDMIKMINQGVDGIITDYPDVLLQILSKD